jgi:hypothetical protein
LEENIRLIVVAPDIIFRLCHNDISLCMEAVATGSPVTRAGKKKPQKHDDYRDAGQIVWARRFPATKRQDLGEGARVPHPDRIGQDSPEDDHQGDFRCFHCP